MSDDPTPDEIDPGLESPSDPEADGEIVDGEPEAGDHKRSSRGGESGRGRLLRRSSKGAAADEVNSEESEPAIEPVLTLSPLEAAIADAVALLSGPGLEPLDDPPPPEELEATWSDEAREGVEEARKDLDGKRVGLAISGGGSLGSFEAGSLRFLYDHLRISPVAITGNSAGALNAAKLAHGDPPDGPRAVDEVERIWRSLRVNENMWEPEPWLERLMASASWATAIREQTNGSSSAVSTVKVAVKVLNSIVRRPPETDGTIDAIKDSLKAQSLLSLEPVAHLVARELDPEAIRTSGIRLRVGTVSLESGELRYITETGELHDRDDKPVELPPVALGDGILASASIPVVFPPVRLGDEHYVDGGAREILPLRILVEHLDVERTIAISAGADAMARSRSFADRGMFDILRRVTTDIATNETLRKELAPPGGWPDDVRLIVPDIEVHDAMMIDPALIAISFDYGWMHTADLICGLSPKLRNLTTEITRTRMALREAAGPLPALFGANIDDRPETDDPDGWVDGELTLRARLREQVQARLDLGGPLPPALVAWLTKPQEPDPEPVKSDEAAAEEPDEEAETTEEAKEADEVPATIG